MDVILSGRRHEFTTISPRIFACSGEAVGLPVGVIVGTAVGTPVR